MNLSIVPNFDGKVYAKDKVKNMALVFQKFPAIELTLCLVKAYPSSKAPLMAIKGPFYQRFKSTIMSKLAEVWMEDCPSVYEMVCCIQDEIVPAILEEYQTIFIPDGADVRMEFANAMELETAYEAAAKAFKRQFDAEEHTCEICTRRLLGDKFTFLTSCEHYFCTECLKAMIETQINSG